MARLLTNSEIERLKRLQIRTDRVPRGGFYSEHRSKEIGHGLEFADHRQYVPGDDIRKVDWNLYRRNRQLFVRLFEENENLPVYILLDLSDSMLFDLDGLRSVAARKLAAAFCAVALNQGEMVQVFAMQDGIWPEKRQFARKNAFETALSHIESLEGGSKLDITDALDQFSKYRIRPGLLIVLSDFFSNRGIDRLCNAVRNLYHKCLFVQMGLEVDEYPVVDSEVRFVDCESGDYVEVADDERLLSEYTRLYQDYYHRLDRSALSMGSTLYRIDSQDNLERHLETLFINGTLRI
ncbi:hypothetical protein SMSP2_01440 [Limihaloglobus sulfuriphilus]|uniref:DUF58 domain-containing protein n=1 Tax=Limihaloglobus sulfuriphilus TaxID=1851148 RepID=A0A1Q2MEE8_9BACT|nr:DUF58 domain-containing protein [Limihaloglobus sulfuriphilus]AQQ71076.1 hypothetical protein SMSP2_01440 [Limihaloglobus sulfuriphilus]